MMMMPMTMLIPMVNGVMMTMTMMPSIISVAGSDPTCYFTRCINRGWVDGSGERGFGLLVCRSTDRDFEFPMQNFAEQILFYRCSTAKTRYFP